ncbi:MAG TPA: hypothetical protein VHF90_06690 [Thermoleophilaceae bacterium]|nr:hypothetical protein [Thermoleophilaceae bacterium]
MSARGDKADARTGQKTWNTPEAIARHRAMTPGERIKKASRLSDQALKMARARRIDADG